MRVITTRRSLRRALRQFQGVLLAVGIVALGYCGYVLLDRWVFQERENRMLEALKRSAPGLPETAGKLRPAVGADGLIGRIEIERLGLSTVILEGTGETTLRRAAGHISGTALPGESGNVGIAAHRDTFFRPLRKIHPDDIVVLITLGGEFRYRVVSTKVVGPEDVAVLDPDGTEILTLVTCYPFYYVGSAPNRFIVRAERIA